MGALGTECGPTGLANLKSGLLHDSRIACAGEGCPAFRRMTYGAANSHYQEPVDQVAAFLIAKDMQNCHQDASFLPYAAGRFGILNVRNGRSLEEASRKLQIGALRKQWFHSAMMEYLHVKGTVFLTDTFWNDPRHWEIAERLLDEEPSIIPEKNPFAGSWYKFRSIAPIFGRAITPAISTKLADIDAPRLYMLIEAAHVRYLAEAYGVDSKLGPVSETQFDEFMAGSFDIAHFRQPVDLDTHASHIRTLIPYIAKATENRVYFADDERTIRRKLAATETTCPGDPPSYYDEKTGSEVLNPLVQYAIYGVEAKRLVAGGSSKIAGTRVSCGLDVLELAKEKGVEGWAPDVSSNLWNHVVGPISELIQTKWNFEMAYANSKQRSVELRKKLEDADAKILEKAGPGAIKLSTIWKIDFE